MCPWKCDVYPWPCECACACACPCACACACACVPVCVCVCYYVGAFVRLNASQEKEVVKVLLKLLLGI